MRYALFFVLTILSHVASLCGDLSQIDPQMLARLEVETWQAYYSKDRFGMIKLMDKTLKEQFHLESNEASEGVIPTLALAAYRFSHLPHQTTDEEYHQQIYPLLVRSYEGLKSLSKAQWDPKKAAQYELEWWMMRRHVKTFNPEIVGQKMAQLYQELYGKKDKNHFYRAAYLRASAARYHDLCRMKWEEIYSSDWKVMEAILLQSYTELLLGIEANQHALPIDQ